MQSGKPGALSLPSKGCSEDPRRRGLCCSFLYYKLYSLALNRQSVPGEYKVPWSQYFDQLLTSSFEGLDLAIGCGNSKSSLEGSAEEKLEDSNGNRRIPSHNLLQPGIPRSPGNQPSSLRFLSPAAQSTPWASPASCPTPVITRNPSLEWDCEPSTTQLGNRESIQGILSIGDRTIPIVSTEESSLSLDSFQTPSREKPVERRVLLPNMDQQAMKTQKSLLAGKIAKLKALVAVSRQKPVR